MALRNIHLDGNKEVGEGHGPPIEGNILLMLIFIKYVSIQDKGNKYTLGEAS